MMFMTCSLILWIVSVFLLLLLSFPTCLLLFLFVWCHSHTSTRTISNGIQSLHIQMYKSNRNEQKKVKRNREAAKKLINVTCEKSILRDNKIPKEPKRNGTCNLFLFFFFFLSFLMNFSHERNGTFFSPRTYRVDINNLKGQFSIVDNSNIGMRLWQKRSIEPFMNFEFSYYARYGDDIEAADKADPSTFTSTMLLQFL